MSKQVFVIKVGGSVLEHLHPSFYTMMQKWIKQQISPIVVHGGGSAITKWMNDLGTKPQFIEGRRVTDKDSLNIVTSVLAGKINKQLVATLITNHIQAIGVSGIDLKILHAEQINPAFGYVGEVIEVNHEALYAMLQIGFVPIIAPLGINANGQHLNINADEAAAAIAQQIGAQKLYLATDVDGIQINDQILKQATATEIENFIQHGEITGGMIPKVQSGLKSLCNVSEEVVIFNGQKMWSFHDDKNIGTHLVKEVK